jgi:hypothetical protein
MIDTVVIGSSSVICQRIGMTEFRPIVVDLRTVSSSDTERLNEWTCQEKHCGASGADCAEFDG